MKLKSKKIVVALVVLALMAMSAVAGAATMNVKITAELNKGYTVKYKGVKQTLKDAKGNVLYPLTYNGTTYMPINAFGSILGVNAGLDVKTQTINMGTVASTTTNLPAFPTPVAAGKYDGANPAPLNVTQATKCTYVLDSGKYYKADLYITITDLKTGPDATAFAKTCGVDLSGLKSNMTVVAAKVSYAYSNASTNDSSGAYADIWFSPRKSIQSGTSSVIGGTDYFTGGLGKAFGSDKFTNGSKKIYTGWALYPVIKDAESSKIGFCGDHDISPNDEDYIWFKLTK